MTSHVGTQSDRLDDVVARKRTDKPFRRDARKPRLLEELFHLRQVVFNKGQDKFPVRTGRRIPEDARQFPAELLKGGMKAAGLAAKKFLHLIKQDDSRLFLCRLAALPRLQEGLARGGAKGQPQQFSN